MAVVVERDYQRALDKQKREVRNLVFVGLEQIKEVLENADDYITQAGGNCFQPIFSSFFNHHPQNIVQKRQKTTKY